MSYIGAQLKIELVLFLKEDFTGMEDTLLPTNEVPGGSSQNHGVVNNVQEPDVAYTIGDDSNENQNLHLLERLQMVIVSMLFIWSGTFIQFHSVL